MQWLSDGKVYGLGTVAYNAASLQRSIKNRELQTLLSTNGQTL